MKEAFNSLKERAEREWRKLWSEEFVLIGAATCGVSAGAERVEEVLREKMREKGMKIKILKVGCIGACFAEPILAVKTKQMPLIFYGSVSEEVVERIFEASFIKGVPLTKHALGTYEGRVGEVLPLFEHPFFRHQERRVLRNCGLIDPENIHHYIAKGGYTALQKALSMNREEVIEEVKRSGLRGRGGAGFPTGRKWEAAKRAKGNKKYVICNADEGDPGAFMDRSLLEGDPHSVLEGMLICAYTIGANEGYIYCRAEYPLALKRVKCAIEQMRGHGLLGENILGTDFSFDIKVKKGAGAFVCGEETALIASIEGGRGEPRIRPPFPAHSGLFDKPTVINNVETFSNISLIIRHGASWFREVGTEESPGTKTFALAGKIKRTGLIEVPMGIKISEIVFDIGGGLINQKRIKAVQIGGPSGGCVPARLLNTSIDYESLKALGAIMGSGGLIVMDESTCMVDVAKYFLDFTQRESCGKCIPCRLGTKQMLLILEDIVKGKGRERDIELLKEVGEAVKMGSLCGLGQSAPNPVLTTLRYFLCEYISHLKYKKCEGGMD